jgi:ketopantoate reductase
MKKKILLAATAMSLCFALGVSYGQVSHAQKALDLLNLALKEAIQCGGGSGCKGPRLDAINSIKNAIASMRKVI